MIILLLSVIYFVLRFSFGLFTPFNFITAGQDIKVGKIQIVDIGEIPINFEKKQKLAKSYGFNFYFFGCIVSKDILNGANYYNKKMVNHLENKYGKVWWTKFQNQLDSIDNIKLQNILADNIKGDWYLNEWTMYHTLSFAQKTVFVDNHIDSVFTLPYSLSNDTLILHNNKSKPIYKEKIITLTNDTMVIKSFENNHDILGYSRTKRAFTNK